MANKEHRFGENDYLDANDFVVGQEIEVPIKGFVGRRESLDKNGRTKTDAYLNVDDRGLLKEFRLGIKNERVLARQFSVKGYEELYNKVVKLRVEKYPMGACGFVVTGLREPNGRPAKQ
jgi:hypothetical protein